VTAPPSPTLNYRRALEALRNGVPNRDAVRVLGSSQHAAEERFHEQLDEVHTAAMEGKQVPGLIVEGGFGSGKSHLIEYFRHLALKGHFVCSRVVISKETPLYEPAKVFQAAIRSASVPDASGEAMAEIAAQLRPNSPPYAELYRWANEDGCGVAPIFPATLLLHERLNEDSELIEQITGFWAGEPLSVAQVRRGLRQIGATASFALRTVPVKDLAIQRIRFAARLIRGAGYAGWVILLDEVELMGKYSLLQRGRSYAELARWLGIIDSEQLPGVVTVATITDDFSAVVLRQKGDWDYVGPRLRSRGTDEFNVLAARAEAGMRRIEKPLALEPPSEVMLKETYGRLKEIYGAGYGWEPPDVPLGEYSIRRAMRSYVRRCINEWDLRRLYPGAEVALEEQELRPSYAEDAALEQTAEVGEEPPEWDPEGRGNAGPVP
jgi:hypothetical protein